MPCFIKPPTNTFPSSFSPGSVNRSFTTVMDFVPTFLELAGVSLPPLSEKPVAAALGKNTLTRKMTTFRGREVHAICGKSWAPYFTRGEMIENNEPWGIHSSTEPVGWELFARETLRKGDWRILHFSKDQGGAAVGDEGWELFNVLEDPGETKDLALSEPHKLKELLACWDDYVEECGVVWGATAIAPGSRTEEAPELWEDDIQLQSSWMGAHGQDDTALPIVSA